jgi:hypothetical protein
VQKIPLDAKSVAASALDRAKMHRGGLCLLSGCHTNAIIIAIVESLGIRCLAIFSVPSSSNRVDVLDVAFKLIGPRLRRPVFAFNQLDRSRWNLAPWATFAAPILTKYMPTVIDVLLNRHPLKIFNAVVLLIAVFVVNLQIARAEKSLCN